MSKLHNLKFNLNGEDKEVQIEPGEILLDVLRNKLFMTGVKRGCDEGECGACTVLLESKPVNSCLIPAMKVQGKHVITIEGLSKSGELSTIQEAFVEAGAVQCGFCTPGVILSVKALLDEQNEPNDEEIKESLSGHLCRCTGYLQFIDAVKIARKKLKKKNELQ